MNLKQLWKKFDREAESCYLTWNGEIREQWTEKEMKQWTAAFLVLQEIVNTGRESNQDFCRELPELDECSGYAHDVGSWLEDYLDVLDMAEQYDSLLTALDDLIGMFDWVKTPASDFKMLRSIVLGRLGRIDEAWEYASQWQMTEPEDIQAVCAAAYAAIPVGKYKEAEQLLNDALPAGSECTEETELLYRAEYALLSAQGKENEAEEIGIMLQKLEDQITKELSSLFAGDFGLDDVPM